MASETKPAATLLTRDAILKADDMTYEVVEVPEWGGSVRVKALNGTERDAFEASLVMGKGKSATVNLQNMRAKLVTQTAVDENGKALFDFADIGALGRKSASALERVFAAARRLSGLSDEDVEELTKNSESDQGDASTSR